MNLDYLYIIQLAFNDTRITGTEFNFLGLLQSDLEINASDTSGMCNLLMILEDQ